MPRIRFTHPRPWLAFVVEPQPDNAGAGQPAAGQAPAAPSGSQQPPAGAPADGKQPPAPGAQQPGDGKAPAAGEKQDKSPNDERVVADLARERKKRQDLEKQLSGFTNAIKALAGEPADDDAAGSDVDRLVNRINALEQQAEASRVAEVRTRVAAEAGVPSELAEFLTATDEETLRAQAQKLVAATAPANGPKRPNPDPAQGAKPNADQLTELDARIKAAFDSGDMATSMALKRQRAALAASR